MTYRKHLAEVFAKAAKMAMVVARLISNMEVPSKAKKAVLMSAVMSRLLYAALA